MVGTSPLQSDPQYSTNGWMHMQLVCRKFQYEEEPTFVIESFFFNLQTTLTFSRMLTEICNVTPLLRNAQWVDTDGYIRRLCRQPSLPPCTSWL
jgi:hypothetical protein